MVGGYHHDGGGDDAAVLWPWAKTQGHDRNAQELRKSYLS
jgi:hypothetical protein